MVGTSCDVLKALVGLRRERERKREGGGEREGGRGGRERERQNSKTLFYKDCSLGSVKI